MLAMKNRGFTLLELLLVIAVIAMLAGLLLAGITQAKEAARSAACKSNLRQIGFALQMYLGDFEEYPFIHNNVSDSPYYWYNLLIPYGASPKPLKCADWNRLYSSATPSYTYNHNLLRLVDAGEAIFAPLHESAVRSPSDLIVLGEDCGWEAGGSIAGFGGCLGHWKPHNSSFNGFFADGHIESSNPSRIQKEDERTARRWFPDNMPHKEI